MTFIKNVKITIDQEKCIGCGTCAAMCPDVFKIDDTTARATVIKPEGSETCNARKTAKTCPVEAIKIE